MRVAAVDIGTNSVRMLVAEHLSPDLFHGERVSWLDRRVVVTRLGQGVDETGALSEEAMGRTVAVLAGFGEAIRAWDVDTAAAVATSATRDAANRDTFLDRAELALGIRPSMITGFEEAALSFMGATAGLDRQGEKLVIDIGGGSTEFVFGSTSPSYSTSVDIGSVRLTERSLTERPVSADNLERARRSADDVFESVALPGEPALSVGTGGTLTSLSAMDLDLTQYDPMAVHASKLRLSSISALVERLALLSIEETAAIPSLDPARAAVLLGGAIVAERALVRLGLESVVISETDILDGIAYWAVRGEL